MPAVAAWRAPFLCLSVAAVCALAQDGPHCGGTYTAGVLDTATAVTAASCGSCDTATWSDVYQACSDPCTAEVHSYRNGAEVSSQAATCTGYCATQGLACTSGRGGNSDVCTGFTVPGAADVNGGCDNTFTLQAYAGEPGTGARLICECAVPGSVSYAVRSASANTACLAAPCRASIGPAGDHGSCCSATPTPTVTPFRASCAGKSLDLMFLVDETPSM